MKNSFNALRLFLALTVLVAHAGPSTSAYDWVHLGKFDIGSIALYAFFTISGFLITPGLQNGKVWAFLRRRIGRIMPGWWAAALVTAGVFATIWQLQDGKFLLTPMQYIKFLASNSVLVPGTATDPGSTWNMLGGLPHSVPAAGQVNVALWSLPIEFACYVILAAIGVLAFRVFKKPNSFRTLITILLIATSMLSIVVSYFAWNLYAPAESLTLRLLQKWPYLLAFVAGAFFQTWSKKLNLQSRWWALSLIFVIWGFNWFWGWSMFGSIAFSIFIIHVGLMKPPVWLVPRRDISYGIYLYHFPVQQTLARYEVFHNPVLMLPVTVVVAAGLAYLSSRFVEIPFGNWIGKGKNPFKTAPLVQTAA